MLNIIGKLLKVLNSETEPSQISLGFCLAMIVGFTPFFSLHNLIIIFVLCIFRINITSFLIGLGFFSGLGYLFDPLFHWVGLKILTTSSLTGLWTVLYNIVVFKLERFYNTMVMGSLFTSVILCIPLFIISNMLVVRYRVHFLKWIEKSRVMHFFKASKIYTAYKAVAG